MKVLIVGASGATGRLLVQELLKSEQEVTIIVRHTDFLNDETKNHEKLTIIKKSISELSSEDILSYVDSFDAIASCLGHTMDLKGIYGHPRKLVTNATIKLCKAVESLAVNRKVKFILMNTTGNSNKNENEQISFAQKCVMSLIRLLLPPHVDNEKAAEFLSVNIGKNNEYLEWVAVRPDTLIDEQEVGLYNTFASPTRSAIFDAGKSSRINVAHFMSELIVNDELWTKWKGKMPVIYNQE